MPDSPLPKTDTLAALPAAWPTDLLPEIQALVQTDGRKVVVLDDDPTGTQTVHGVPVLTEWSVGSLAAELRNELPALYLLTNSRSMTLDRAQALNREIGANLLTASEETGRDFVLVSRSDSTLRGHFPGEVDALASSVGGAYRGLLIVPYFLEGGRYTIEDVHYVAEGDFLIPAGQTQFAADAAFGYRSSNLRDWVEEKTDGRIAAAAVASISLATIRQQGPQGVSEQLAALGAGAVCIVNAVAYRDLDVFVAGLLQVEAQGLPFLYRTAASFVRVRAGIQPRPLLTGADLGLRRDSATENGALIVAGSYVPKTTSQVAYLLDNCAVSAVEVDVGALLDGARREDEIARVVAHVNAALAAGEDVVVYTSRELVTGSNAAGSLDIGRQVSEGLVSVVRSLSVQPRYILAKGGITSSDVATAGLDIRRAMVAGSILPGIPVWELGTESRFPGMPYIVFPGNVGGDDAIAEIVEKLETKPSGDDT